MKKYTIEKTFTKGILKGIVITEQTDILFRLGKQCGNYKVTAFLTN
jgi:hypothetical protein